MRPFPICILLLAALGCGGNVEVPANSDGSGGSLAGGGIEGPSCSSFDNQESTASLEVVFRNDDSQPIYLHALCSTPELRLSAEDPALQLGVVDTCLPTCEKMRKEAVAPCDADPCPTTAFRLDPGKSANAVWSGAVVVHDRPMPKSCFYSEEMASPCSQIISAPAGTYTLETTGHASCGDDCTCNEDGGWCSGPPTGATTRTEPIQFEFPKETRVEVVFPPCSFGCSK